MQVRATARKGFFSAEGAQKPRARTPFAKVTKYNNKHQTKRKKNDTKNNNREKNIDIVFIFVL